MPDVLVELIIHATLALGAYAERACAETRAADAAALSTATYLLRDGVNGLNLSQPDREALLAATRRILGEIPGAIQ